jgi:hypothetical protein
MERVTRERLKGEELFKPSTRPRCGVIFPMWRASSSTTMASTFAFAG